MQKELKIHDKVFELYLSDKEIASQISRLSQEVNTDFDSDNLVFLIVLNGAFMFASDFLKNYEPACSISFVKISSYQGMSSSGKVKFESEISVDLSQKDVVILEDIVDTGLSISKLSEKLIEYQPKSINVCSLLFKPNSFQGKDKPKYIGFSIPDKFVVGYGMDYLQKGRNLKDLYQLKE